MSRRHDVDASISIDFAVHKPMEGKVQGNSLSRRWEPRSRLAAIDACRGLAHCDPVILGGDVPRLTNGPCKDEIIEGAARRNNGGRA
jgi:hypothetical protein